MDKAFVHLHTHSEFSELDGLAKIQDYIDKAIKFGMTALAITDHGSTSGSYELFQLCNGTPIKPILGTEFYIKTEYGRGHLIALAMNNNGWKNILKLQKYAFSERGFDRKPCIDMKSLRRHNEDIIITSACIANPIGYLIGQDREEEAIEMAIEFQEIFGDRFYIELQSSKMERQDYANKGLIRIANKIGAEMILTNDCHYVEEEDAYAQEVLLAVQTKAKMTDENRFKFDSDDYYFKSYDEMIEYTYFDEAIAHRALHNTIEVADRCNATIETGSYFPSYHTLPKGQDGQALLRRMVTRRYKEDITGAGLHSKQFADDVANELGVICNEGFADYFLIVQDYVNWARHSRIIVGDGRGSGASSKTAFTIGITAINPDNYNLLFERFLSNGRIPDFDVDFSDREAVIDYIIETYGSNNVAIVGSFNYMSTKAVIRKVLSAFDYESYYITALTKTIDEGSDLESALKKSAKLKGHFSKNPDELKVIRRLYNVISHPGIHAGGVIIYPNIAELIPVRTLGANRNKLIAYLDKRVLEWLGHVKFDVLGLESLTVMEDSVKSIAMDLGTNIVLHDINYDDQKVYGMLTQGDVSGIFQLANQADMLMEQKPNCFDDIIAINAFLRPGVGDWEEYISRRNGKAYYLHPLREPYLKETCGIIAYQEQFEMDCKVFAGWSIAYADKHVRKNYNLAADTELQEKFMKDGKSLGFSEALLTRIWSEILMAATGGYSFNKSHAASYAILSYQSAWLKYNYPAHFYASLMTKEGDDATKLSNLIAEAKRKKLEILPPDINSSTEKFVAKGNKIYYRITSIVQVGPSAIKSIILSRPIKSIEELIEATTRASLKTNVIMNLIKAGCFDFQNTNRFEVLNLAQRELEIPEENYPKFNDIEKGRLEKQGLGIYLTNHPLDQFYYKPFYDIEDKTVAITAGEVVDVSEIKDKNGNLMAFVTISNQYGSIKCIIFSSSWDNKMKETFMLNEFVAIKGTKSGTSLLIIKATKMVLE
jgi:DNA polymerase-3 subunit alpha